MKSNNKKGFSLIELMAVVLIIGVLAAIALPMYQKAVLKSRSAEVNNLLTLVRTKQARHFAKHKEYSDTFTGDLSQITKDGSVEKYVEGMENKVKTINDDYELELVNHAITTEDGQTKNMRCVIGRYKPNGDANFAFAISYTKSGLGCNDSTTNSVLDTAEYSKNICSSFGDVVGTVEDLCEVNDAELGPLSPVKCCIPYETPNYQSGTCDFWSEPGNNLVLVSYNDGCTRCKYCEGENCLEEQEAPVVERDEDGHVVKSIPEIGNTPFPCKKKDADGKIVMDTCNSRDYKIWNQQVCDWICDPNEDHSDLCASDESWDTTNCICRCALGEQCGCHVSQNPVYATEDDELNLNADKCVCKNPEEGIYQGSDAPCYCKAKHLEVENPGDRIFDIPGYNHCYCNLDYTTPVLYGTITSTHGNPGYKHLSPADDSDFEGDWEAGAPCCRNAEVWPASSNFAHDACCPFVDINIEDSSEQKHVEFNISSKECCGNEVPFFNLEEATNVADQTYGRNIFKQLDGSSTSLAANTCHKCPNLIQAWDDDRGCYQCKGITFTIWGGGVSQCKCPTGTQGTPSTPWDAESTFNDCTCKKDNTTWNSTINYIENASTGPVDNSTWHATNGACKCIEGYTDTYFGKKMGAGEGTVSAKDGYCCPSTATLANIYNGSSLDSSLTNQKACCPNGKSYFHHTTYAYEDNDGNVGACSVCPNQTDTWDSTNGCHACPAGMEPRFSVDDGYSLCYCPQGTHVKEGASDGVSIAANTDISTICECNLQNAKWEFPSGVTNTDFVNAVANNTTSQLTGWSDTHGYCVCKPGYGYSTNGNYTQNGNEINVPSTGYCCPNPPQNNQLWHQTQENPEDGYCCSSNVGFNDEPDYTPFCCPAGSPNYFSLDKLEDYGLTQEDRAGYDEDGNPIADVATIGGCSPCDDPTKTLNEENKCVSCLTPKVPVWNNKRTLGYSQCVCPYPSTADKPTWWQYLFSWFGYEIPEQGCYCDIAGTVWSDEKVNGSHCVCYEDDAVLSTAFDDKQACCPDGEVFAMPALSGTYEWEDHRCCPKNKQFFYNGDCQQCPTDRPYYYIPDGSAAPTNDMYDNIKNLTKFVGVYCHVCPEGKHEYAGKCCDDTLENCIACPHCTSTSSDTISCTQGENGTVSPVVSWNGTAFACSCGNNATYSSAAGCLCPSKCDEDGLTSLYYGQYFSQASCDCGEPREFKPGCCTNSDIACCQCKEGYVEFGQEGDLSRNGCCLNEDYTDGACCGKVGNQAIAYNPYDKTCCTADAPNYDAEKKLCYKCPADKIWNGTKCVSCPQNQYPYNWQNGAYTQCKCMVGSEDGKGSAISFTDFDGSGLATCKCEETNAHYLNTQTLETASYSVDSNGAAEENEKCMLCPDNLPFSDGKCQCPTNSTWSSSHNHCARCPDTQVWNGSACVDCGGPTEVDQNSWQYDSNNKFGAYTQCKCQTSYASSSYDGQPGVNNPHYVPYSYDSVPGVSACYCLNGQYYLTSSYANTAVWGEGSCTSCPTELGYYSAPEGGQCVCDNTLGFTEVNGQCVCNTANNYVPYNGQCVYCPVGRGFSISNNECVCSSGHIISITDLSYNDNLTVADLSNTNYYCGTCGAGLYSDVSGCHCSKAPYNNWSIATVANVSLQNYNISGSCSVSHTTTSGHYKYISSLKRKVQININGADSLNFQCSYSCQNGALKEFSNAGDTINILACAGYCSGETCGSETVCKNDDCSQHLTINNVHENQEEFSCSQ